MGWGNVLLAAFAAFMVGASSMQAWSEPVSSTHRHTAEHKAEKRRGAGLSGSEGTVKKKVMFLISEEGGCAGLYKRYVDASGHSAYAATANDYFSGDGYVCGAGYNAASQAAAEREAIASCNSGLKKFKGYFIRKCEIYASK